MLRLTILAFLASAVWAECPMGFQLVHAGECQRHLYDGQETFAKTGAVQAISSCASYNSIPVNIKNQTDHDYWVSVAANDRLKGPEYGNIILGLYCDDTNHWMWADGRNAYYEWRPYDVDQALFSPCFEDDEYCMWTINPVTGDWDLTCNAYAPTSNYCTTEHPKIPAPDQYCTNFEIESSDAICYQVGRTPANWTEANTICHSFGASVASIHQQRENDFVRRLAVSQGLVNGMLIGGSLNKLKTAFQWADGTKWDYDNFAPGFPLDGLGDCIAMETNNLDGQWINIDCSTELPFSCVRPMYSAPPVCDGALYQPGDIIYSPGFPSIASVPCDFILKVDPGMLVEVEILMLEANSCCDRLVLTEGALGGQGVAVLTGDHFNGFTFRTYTQNVMRVSWQPQGGVNVKGMMITFRAVPFVPAP